MDEYMQHSIMNHSHSNSNVSTSLVSGSDPTPNSSSIGTPEDEDIFQASIADRGTGLTHPDLQDGIADLHGSIHKPRFRCSDPACAHISFGLKKDLTRHEKTHDTTNWWKCGCCQNLGHTIERNPRKYKVQRHLKRTHQHEESKYKGDKLGEECPEKGCNTLFTAASCLYEHLRQEHPLRTQEMPSQAIDENMCDCNQTAESRRLGNCHQSETSKHRAQSPLESIAKREKHVISTQALELVQQSAEFRADWDSTRSSTAGIPSIGGLECIPLELVAPMFSTFTNEQCLSWSHMGSPIGIAEANEAFTEGGCWYGVQGDMNLGVGSPYPSPYMAPVASYSKTPVRELVFSRPAEFLAVRETEDFKKWACILRGANDNDPHAPTSPITYNPVKEVITLQGWSESTIEKAKTTLLCLLDNFSKRWGDKDPVTSHSGMNYEAPRSRAYKFDLSSAHSNTSSKDPKFFPIKPKEHGELIEIWFNRLLPALPQILTTALKGDYTASLVRRGKDGIGPKPCIIIESPHIPGKEAQNITREKVNNLCSKYSHQPIETIFFQGSFRHLNGGADEGNDVAEQNADLQRLRFNLFRPSAKPAMGASLGLLCSRNISATLGGYVLVDGTRYMLTSDHLIEESWKTANKDCNEADTKTITSPSREDLIYLKNCLEQTKRDVELEIESLTKEIWGDEDIAEESFSDQTPKLSDARNRLNDVDCYIGQVTKQPSDYAIGTVANRSIEPRAVPIPRHLAGRLRFEAKMLTHYMDWALCKITGETGENRHKYPSNEDAMGDDYIEDQALANQPTDICHETCNADAAIAIYYVGQGSGHRSGVVNIPMLVKRDDYVTHEWSILSSDGQAIRLPDVAGDSGAWVIRKHGNKLMGQVLAHSTGQVLFTPIDVIFADLKQQCGLDVSLPPASQNPDQTSIAASATPLCSGDFWRRVGPLTSLVKPTAASANLGKSAIGVDLSDTRPLKLSSELASPSETDNAHGEASSSPLHDLLSSIPSLTDSLKSPAKTADSQQSSLSSGGVDLSDKQVGIEKLSSESPRTIVAKSTEPETPLLTLDEQSEAMDMVSSGAFEFKPEFRFRITLKARTPTWPTDRKSKVMKARVWSRFSQPKKSRDHEVAPVARSVLESAWHDRRNADVGDFNTLRGSYKRKESIPLMLENVIKRQRIIRSERLNSLWKAAEMG